MLNFKGVGVQNSKILYLRLAEQDPRIKELHNLLLEEFSMRGIECATRFSPHVAIAETKGYKNGYFGSSIKKTLSEVEILNTNPVFISMISFTANDESRSSFLLKLPLQREEVAANDNKLQDSKIVDPSDEKAKHHQDPNQL